MNWNRLSWCLVCVCWLSLGLAPPASAFDGKPWSLGVITGGGLGAGNCDDAICSIPNVENEVYGFATVMATAAYRFSESHSTRLSLGIDKYVLNSAFTNAYKISAAVEGAYVYHFTNERAVFAPYLLAGFRYPTANIGLGFGNEFTVQDSLSLLVEVMASTMFTFDQRFELRLGLMKHF